MAAGKIDLNVDINVNDKNAQSKINKLKAGLATFSGIKTEIKADVVGGDKAAQRLDELIDKLSKVRKIAGEKADLFDLNSLKQAGTAIDKAIKSATGNAKKNLINLRSDIDETLNLIQGRVNVASAQRAAQRSTLSFEGTGKYWNDQRKARLQQIEEGLVTARQTEDYKEQISLLREKVKILEKIDKFNKAQTANPEIDATRKEIEAVRQKASATRLAQQQQERAAREAEAASKRMADLQAKIANIDRQRLDNQKLTVNTNQRLQNEIRLMQIKLGYLRQIDMLQNGGKASKATLAAEAQLRNLQHTNGLLQQQGGILGRLKGLATQYLSIFAVWNFGKKIADTTGYFEQQKVALEGILGSASDAEKAFTRMQKMALQSPFELKEIVGQTKQAAAYGIGDGDTNKLLEDVKMLGDLSAGLGVDMQRLILAYGQVKAAAVLRGQELRQFTEAGIPMVQALADKFTQLNGKLVTTGEVFELISKRQVSFEMVASVMRDMTAEGGKFNNMQEKITETLYGQMQKLKDMWTQSMNSIGSGMNTALMGIVKILQAIVKHAGSLMRGGIIIALYAAIKKIGSQLILLKENVRSAGIAFRYLRISVAQANGALATTRAVARGLGAIFASLATSGVLVLVSALVALGSAVTQANREFKRKMDDIASSFQKDEERLTTGFDNLISKIQNFAAGTKAYNQALDSLKSNYGEYISSGLIQKMEEERNAIDKTTLSWQALAESVKEAIKVKMQYERSQAEMDAETNAIAESMTSFGSIFTGRNLKEILQQYIKNYEIRNDVTGTRRTGLTPSDMERYVNNTLDTFRINRGRTLEDFQKAFSEQNISNSTIRDILQNALPSIFESVKTSSAFDKYINSLNDLESNPLFRITEAFAQAEKKADLNNEGRFAGRIGSDEYNSATSAASMAYNPIAWENMRKGELLSAAKGLVEEFYGAITDSDLKERFEKALTVGEEGMTIGKTKEAVDAISELIGTLDSEADATKIMKLNTVLKELQDRAGTVSGYVAEVAEDFNKFFGRQNSAAMEDFYKRYMPNNENYEQKLKEVESDRKAAEDWLEKNAKWKGQKGKRGEEYARMVLEKQWLDEIWGGGKNGKFFNQSEKAKKGGGGSKPRYTDFINDMLQVIINADKNVKKIAQVTGYTGEMTNFVNNLDEDNITRKFFTLGANPFEDIFNKMAQYGIDTKMVKGLDKNILTTILKEVGWEEGKTMNLPDFKAMYERLIKNLSDKVVPLITDERERMNVEKYLGNALFKSPWATNEIEDKLTAMVRSLGNIEQIAAMDSHKRTEYERLAKAGGPDSAYRAIYGTGWTPYDRRQDAQKALAAMLSSEAGKGTLSTYVGQDINNMLSSGELLNISNLQMLNEAKMRIKEQQNVLLKAAEEGDKDAAREVEQFGKVAQKFDKAIDDMVESIIKAYEEIPRTEIEKTTVALENFFKQFKQNISVIQKEGGDNQTAREIDETKRLYDNIAKQLGGTGRQGGIDVLKMMGNGKVSFAAQNLLQGMSGKTGFLEMMQNGFAQGAVNGGSAAGASAGAAGAAGAVAIVDAIIRGVYQAINAIGEFIKISTKMIRSNNKLIATWKDENGYRQFEREHNERDLERLEQSTENFMRFNQHVFDGWEKLKGGDVFGALYETYAMWADLVTDLNGLFDFDIETQIKDLEDSNKSLEHAIKDAEWEINYKAGIESMNRKGSEVNKYLKMAANLQEKADLEQGKKGFDEDKIRQFEDEAEQNRRNAIDIIHSMREEIFQTADDIANRLTDAFVDAFKNGTNAARDWASAVKSYMGEVLQTMILEKVLAPKIQSVIDEWMGGTEEELAEAHKNDENYNYGDYVLSRLQDENAGKQAQKSLYALGDWMTDYYEGLGQWTKDMIAFNPDTSSLSGGIQGMTEDTGRTLEGLGNSILMQHVLTNQKMDEIKALPFAQVQTSWFKDMLMQSQAIALATQSLNNAINDVRNGVRPLYVTMQ